MREASYPFLLLLEGTSENLCCKAALPQAKLYKSFLARTPSHNLWGNVSRRNPWENFSLY